MEPVNSNISASFTAYRRVNSIESSRKSVSLDIFLAEQNSSNSADPALVKKLPNDPAQGLANIFQNINILALQSAEVFQTVEVRENLHTEATNELQELRTILAELSRDDLQLFIAVFENNLPEFSSNSNTFNDDNRLSDVSFNDSATGLLNDLFEIDLRSEQGALSALNLASGVLDTLSIFNTGSNFLESLLEDLSGFNFNIAIIESLNQTEESVSTSEDTENGELPVQYSPLVPPDSNPPTIIEFAG